MPLKTSLNVLRLSSSFIKTNRTVRPILNLPPQKTIIAKGTDSDFFERVSPEDVGYTQEYICSYFNEIENDHTIIPHHIMILKNGKVIGEKTYAPYDSKIWNAAFSFTKTTIGLAIGFLYDEGKIDIEEKYQKILFPKYGAYNIYQKDVTVRHLLTMTSGVKFNESSSAVSKEWAKDFIASGVKFKPGTAFEYNSLNTYMLCAIVHKLTGETVSSYLGKKLYSKLGINDYFYETSPEGIEKGGWGLYLTVESMAKLGQLILNDGKWQGKRIISHEWIELMSTTKVNVDTEVSKFDYGYQMWTREKNHICCFNGLFDQDVLVYKDTGVIVANCCGNNDAFHSNNIMKINEKYFAKPFNEKFKYQPYLNEKENNINNKDLMHYYNWINGSYYKAVEKNTVSVNIIPFILQLIMNTFTEGFSGFAFKKEKNYYILHVDQHNNDVDLKYDFKDGIRQIISFYGNKYDCVVRGRMLRNEDGLPFLMITLFFLEFAHDRNIKFYFTKNNKTLNVEMNEIPGKDFIFSLVNADKKTVKLVNDVTNVVDPSIIMGKLNELINPTFTAKKQKYEDLHNDEQSFLAKEEPKEVK